MVICVVEELLLHTGFVRVMVDRSWATCRRAQPSRTLVGCLLVLTFSSSKTLNSPLDRVGDFSFFYGESSKCLLRSCVLFPCSRFLILSTSIMGEGRGPTSLLAVEKGRVGYYSVGSK